jgi:hypothetical protein
MEHPCWHALYDTLKAVENQDDWIAWQSDLARELDLPAEWQLGHVSDLMDAVEVAMFDCDYRPRWPSRAPTRVIEVAKALPVPQRAQIAALRCALQSANRYVAGAVVPLSPESRRARAPHPRPLFSTQLQRYVYATVGEALATVLLNVMAILLRDPEEARRALCVVITDAVDETAFRSCVATCGHGLLETESVSIIPDPRTHEHGLVVTAVIIKPARHG